VWARQKRKVFGKHLGEKLEGEGEGGGQNVFVVVNDFVLEKGTFSWPHQKNRPNTEKSRIRETKKNLSGLWEEKKKKKTCVGGGGGKSKKKKKKKKKENRPKPEIH